MIFGDIFSPKENKSHRAVSPVIATLILVAIAVVAGVMVFVFTQGYITSGPSQKVSTDLLTMTGYDLRETTMTDHLGATLASSADSTTNDGKNTNEIGAIYIKNIGTNDVTISKVEVNGRTMVVGTSILATAGGAGTAPAAVVLHAASGASGITTTSTSTTVTPNEEVTIQVKFDSNAAAASGRTITLSVATSSGGVFDFHGVVGQKG